MHLDVLTSSRVHKREAPGVQERSIEFRERHAVASIPNDTVTDRGEVYPNLVGAPGLKRELNQRGDRKSVV